MTASPSSPRPAVEGELAHGRLATQPAQVRVDLLEPRVEPLALDLQAADVVARGRHADLLREGEEREHEGDDDQPEQEPGTCPDRPMRTDRGTRPPARQGRRRRLDEPRSARQARSCVDVRPGRRPSISRRSRSGSAARADRGTPAGRMARRSPTPRDRRRRPPRAGRGRAARGLRAGDGRRPCADWMWCRLLMGAPPSVVMPPVQAASRSAARRRALRARGLASTSDRASG